MKTRSLPCKRPGKECSRTKAWEAEPGGERDEVVWRGRWELCQAEQSFCRKDPLLLEGFSRAGTHLEVHSRHSLETTLWRVEWRPRASEEAPAASPVGDRDDLDPLGDTRDGEERHVALGTGDRTG